MVPCADGQSTAPAIANGAELLHPQIPDQSPGEQRGQSSRLTTGGVYAQGLGTVNAVWLPSARRARRADNIRTHHRPRRARLLLMVNKPHEWILWLYIIVWPAKALPQSLDSNLYYNASAAPRWERDGVAYRAFADYQQAAGEMHSRYAAPQLAGPADAHLQPGSPAIDAGAAQQEVTVDIEGIARPQGAACDIGAYERKVTTK